MLDTNIKYLVTAKIKNFTITENKSTGKKANLYPRNLI